jgi:hypothetical protein
MFVPTQHYQAVNAPCEESRMQVFGWQWAVGNRRLAIAELENSNLTFHPQLSPTD